MDQANELRKLMAEIHRQNAQQRAFASRTSKVITITSGKGGVGKSNFSLNLSLYLSSIGKKVIIIDADFGCANIEVLFGVRPEYSFHHIVKGEKNISEVIIDTKFGIKFISGGSGFKDLSNLTEREVNYFIEQFEYLDNLFDIIIVDTGSGISRNVTNFAKASDEVIIVTTPEPTSFTDAYAFMKVIATSEVQIPTMQLVVNKTEDYFEAINIYNKLSSASLKFLNIKLENLGYIPLDDNLVRAVKRQEPVILQYPDSKFSEAIKRIGQKLLDQHLSYENDQNTIANSGGVKNFMKKLVNIFSK